MAINAAVEDEQGNTLTSSSATLSGLTALVISVALDDDPWLGGIDPYGDTTFNRIQVPHLLRDLRRIVEAHPEVSADVQIVSQLAEQVVSRHHAYLCFYGD